MPSVSDMDAVNTYEADLSQIRKDIPRTFPEEPSVRSCSHVIEAILAEHAKFDPELGYCQGMSCVAAVIAARIVDVNGASSFFRRLVENLRGLWLPGFPLLTAGTTAFESLQRSALPSLHGHLESLGASSDMFLPDAWLTLFSRWLPFVSLWPVFVFLEDEGISGLVALTTVLLQLHETVLLSTGDFTEVFVTLKTLGRCTQPPDTQVALVRARKLLPQVRALLPARSPVLNLTETVSWQSARYGPGCPRLERRGSRVFHAQSNVEAVADELDLQSLKQLARLTRNLSMGSVASSRAVILTDGEVSRQPRPCEGWFFSDYFGICCASEQSVFRVEKPSGQEWL